MRRTLRGLATITSWPHSSSTLLTQGECPPRWRLAAAAARRRTVALELRGGAQPALFHNLTALCVDEAQVGAFVAEIEPGCHLRLFAATIHGGPILLPGRKSPYSTFADPKVLR